MTVAVFSWSLPYTTIRGVGNDAPCTEIGAGATTKLSYTVAKFSWINIDFDELVFLYEKVLSMKLY